MASSPAPLDVEFNIAELDEMVDLVMVEEPSIDLADLLNGDGNDSKCQVERLPFVDEQFILVFCIGTTIACTSIFLNLVLLHLFVTRPYFRKSNFFYLTVLAGFDICHSTAYIAVMCTVVYAEYFQYASVMSAWYMYVIPLTTLDYVFVCTSAYLLVAASVERYASAHWHSNFFQQKARFASTFGIFCTSVLMNGGMYWEMKVQHLPKCEGIHKHTLLPTDLMMNHSIYRDFYAYWLRNAANVFVPFLLLIFLNAGVILQDRWPKCPQRPRWCRSESRRESLNSDADRKVSVATTISLRLRRAMSSARFSHDEESGRMQIGKTSCGLSMDMAAKTSRWVRRAKRRVRKSATRTLIAIVIEYLISNGLAVVVTSWENIDRDSLESHGVFYTFASDCISLFTVISCAIRLPTYCLCDITLRKELKWMITQRSRDEEGETRQGASMSDVVSSALRQKREDQRVTSFRQRLLSIFARRPPASRSRSVAAPSASLRNGSALPSNGAAPPTSSLQPSAALLSPQDAFANARLLRRAQSDAQRYGTAAQRYGAAKHQSVEQEAQRLLKQKSEPGGRWSFGSGRRPSLAKSRMGSSLESGRVGSVPGSGRAGCSSPEPPMLVVDTVARQVDPMVTSFCAAAHQPACAKAETEDDVLL